MKIRPAASDSSLSLWIDTTEAPSYPPLDGNSNADVAIAGGGITGIIAAYLLAKAGKSVVLIEKGRIAMSESGHTTAHIVESTDADYEQLVEQHGEEGAALDTAAIRGAIALIHALVDELAIDCDLHAVDGYLYAESEEDRAYLERQQENLAKTGTRAEWTDNVPLPFPTIGGLRFPNQFAFHIRKFLLPLAAQAIQMGARIFENTLVTDVRDADDDGRCTLVTEGGNIRALHVILATHVPINDRGAIWAKMHVTRTYVVAAPIEPGRVPDGLFWDTADPYHYTRLVETEKGLFLIVGGEDRDIGDPENSEERYAALEQYCRERFSVEKFTYRWSGQINEPADTLPLIGESSHGKNIWMSTGYSGTGMTYGTLAAMILSDLVLGNENRFAKLYDPGRKRLKAMLENVAKAVKFPKRMVERITDRDVEGDSLDDVAEGEGKIVEIGGAKLAVARLDGHLHIVNPTCTHMGCTVSWNRAESSWDCPCHGSRFDVHGRVLNAPATKDLERKD